MLRQGNVRFWLVWFAFVTAMLAFAAGCGKPADPVVGKWLDRLAYESTVEFRADGTARMDVDSAKMRSRLNRLHPGQQVAVEARINKTASDFAALNGARMTWAKSGDVYVLSAVGAPSFMSYKLEGETLYAWRGGRTSMPYARVTE